MRQFKKILLSVPLVLMLLTGVALAATSSAYLYSWQGSSTGSPIYYETGRVDMYGKVNSGLHMEVATMKVKAWAPDEKIAYRGVYPESPLHITVTLPSRENMYYVKLTQVGSWDANGEGYIQHK
ncbi:MAG: hypothetical protein IMX04_03000 [Candidatus Carbobacillus altaicus]|nr:hypothetical protein [Candidatus Carbobacillus altaicus]